MYTQIKVVTIIAINGLLRLNELVAFDWKNVSQGSVEDGTESRPIIQLSVERSKRSGPKAMKKFLVSDPLSIEILTRYMDSFEDKQGRFFRKLKNDLKPSLQPIGQAMLTTYPQRIAEYLKLPEPEKYTSHSFRHSGASILADELASVLQLQQAGGWESATVAQSYVEEGTHSRLQISERFHDSTSSSGTTKRARTSYAVTSSNDHSFSHIPAISIGAGSSNNSIHVHIGYNPATSSAVYEQS